jgi:hypothetical protein
MTEELQERIDYDTAHAAKVEAAAKTPDHLGLTEEGHKWIAGLLAKKVSKAESARTDDQWDGRLRRMRAQLEEQMVERYEKLLEALGAVDRQTLALEETLKDLKHKTPPHASITYSEVGMDQAKLTFFGPKEEVERWWRRIMTPGKVTVRSVAMEAEE